MTHRIRQRMEKIVSGTVVGDIPKLIPGTVLAFFIWYVSEILCNFIGKTLMGFKSSPVSTIMVTIIIGILIRNSIGLHPSLAPGTSFAVGSGRWGASAIVATAPTIEATEEEVTYAVTNITLFGVLAMFLYPYIADLIFTGNRILAGLFLGTSIHETAQVAGGAMVYDQYMLTT